MSRLTHSTLSLLLLAYAYDSGAEDALGNEYTPAQRESEQAKENKAGPVTNGVEYRFGNNSFYYPQGAKISDEFKQKIIKHAQQRIECNDITSARGEFDKPLPAASWLYPKFSDKSTRWRNYFDTNEQEYWVFPNVYCNQARALTAISWARSGKKGAYEENKDMAWRFRAHQPQLPASSILDNQSPSGVYCGGWGNGWLFEKNKSYREFIKVDGSSNVSLLMLNIYCHQNRVIYMQHGRAGEANFSVLSRIPGAQRVIRAVSSRNKPFANVADPQPSADGSIGCSWRGWLLKDGTAEPPWTDKDGKQRWSYEKYFTLDNKAITDPSKVVVHGRVVNPFCSHGKVTRLRAYCFYPPTHRWKEKRNTCDDM